MGSAGGSLTVLEGAILGVVALRFAVLAFHAAPGEAFRISTIPADSVLVTVERTCRPRITPVIHLG